MPLLFTKDAWIKNTEVSWRKRSAELKAIDDALEREAPFSARDALDAWIAAQIRKHPNQNWRQNERNRTGAIQALYDYVDLDSDIRRFVQPLARAAIACRAGSRHLQVEDGKDTGPFVKSLIAWGFRNVVTQDNNNLMSMYATIMTLREEVVYGRVPLLLMQVLQSVPSRPHFEGLALGGRNFLEWATAARANCGHMGSGDAAKWVEYICRKTGHNWILYQYDIQFAKERGRQEEREFEVEKERREKLAQGINAPDLNIIVDDYNLYLKQVLVLNRGKPEHLVHRFFDEQRDHITGDWGVVPVGQELNVITWQAAKRATNFGAV